MPEITETPSLCLPRRDMSDPKHARVDNAFILQGYSELIAGGLAVYTVLCMVWNKDIDACRISLPKLRQYAGMSRRKVIDVIACLTYYRIIQYIPHHGRGNCNEYRLIDRKAWLPIEKGAHDALFKTGKNHHNVAIKGAHTAPINVIKGAKSDKKKVHQVHPYKSKIYKSGGGGSFQGPLPGFTGAKSDVKTASERYDPATAHSLQKPPRPLLKILSPEEEEERKNFLHQQLLQIQQEANT